MFISFINNQWFHDYRGWTQLTFNIVKCTSQTCVNPCSIPAGVKTFFWEVFTKFWDFSCYFKNYKFSLKTSCYFQVSTDKCEITWNHILSIPSTVLAIHCSVLGLDYFNKNLQKKSWSREYLCGISNLFWGIFILSVVLLE